MGARPKILSAPGTLPVKVEVPPGWSVDLSAVSRKPYRRRIMIDIDVGDGQEQNCEMSNTWGEMNETMREVSSRVDVAHVIPQDDPVTISLDAYFSTSPRPIKDDELAKYRSSRVNVLETDKPPGTLEDFPDYTTYYILVEDDGAKVQGTPEFDDALVLINIMRVNEETKVPQLQQMVVNYGNIWINGYNPAYNGGGIYGGSNNTYGGGGGNTYGGAGGYTYGGAGGYTYGGSGNTYGRPC